MMALSVAVRAQFTKGTIMAGGSVGFSAMKNKETQSNVTTTIGTTTTFTFLPQVGYFFIDNLAVGAEVALQSEKFKNSDSNAANSTTTFLFSPFVRYYFPPKVYAQFSFGVGPGTNRNTNDNGVTTESSFVNSGWSILAGYAYMLNNHVAIEPQLGYSSRVQNYSVNNFKTSDSGIFLRIGLQVYLHK